MDIEKRARRQSRRIIISEILMVITVIITVSILAFIVSGYWVNSDFKIERQGLLQIYSTPTGADIKIDDETLSWTQRTNTSKTLSAGKHTITLTKEGYDSWSRTINISEGLLYRLHYPRLFLQNRLEESVLSTSANFATVTPDRNTMLLANNTTSWQLVNLDNDQIKLTTLDLSKTLPFTNHGSNDSVSLFTGVIDSAKWASDNEHLLLKIRKDTQTNWVLLNIKNPSISINLTQDYNADFSEIKILDQSASNLLVILDNNLHRIDIPARQISAILVPDINSFDFYHQRIVFAAKNPDFYTNSTNLANSSNDATNSSQNPYYIGSFRLGDNNIKKLKSTPTANQVVITKFYDDEYIGIIDEKSIELYLEKNFELKNTFPLSFKPESTIVTNAGESITMYAGEHIATLDLEAMEIFDWNTGTDKIGWLDGSIIYAVKNNILNIYDFNGLNHRILSNNVSSHFPATITSDKYLYYFRDGSLIREYLFEK